MDETLVKAGEALVVIPFHFMAATDSWGMDNEPFLSNYPFPITRLSCVAIF